MLNIPLSTELRLFRNWCWYNVVCTHIHVGRVKLLQ